MCSLERRHSTPSLGDRSGIAFAQQATLDLASGAFFVSHTTTGPGHQSPIVHESPAMLDEDILLPAGSLVETDAMIGVSEATASTRAPIDRKNDLGEFFGHSSVHGHG